MRTILCNDCGNIASRFQNECGVCSRTNLSFYPGVNSEELKARIKEIKGDSHDLKNRLMVLSFIGIVFVMMAYHYNTAVGPQTTQAVVQQPIQTAASDTSGSLR